MAHDGAPSMGHNRKIEIEEDAFLAHVAAVQDATSQVNAAKLVLKKARRQAKSDGIKLKLLDECIKRADMDRDEVEEHFLHMQHYMQWLRHPIGHQFVLDIGEPADGDFEDEDVVRGKALDKAGKDGFWDGLRGAEQSTDYDKTSEIGQAYLKNYGEGRARRAHESAEPHDDD